MRRSLWLCVAMVLTQLACSCGKDPVLGKWVESGAGNISLEFKADGTVAQDASVEAIAAMAGAQNPLIAAQAAALAGKARDALRNMKATWAREGKLYKVSGTNPFSGQPADVYFRIEGKDLVSCKPDGAALQARFVRQKQ